MKYLLLLPLLLLSTLFIPASSYAQNSQVPTVFYCIGTSSQPPCKPISSSHQAPPNNNPKINPTSSPTLMPCPSVQQSSANEPTIQTKTKHRAPMKQGLLQQSVASLLQPFSQQSTNQPSPASPCSKTTSTSGSEQGYIISKGYIGKCLDNTNNNKTSGNQLQITDCTDGASQQWTRSGNVNDRAYTTNGLCLSTISNQTSNGTKVRAMNCGKNNATTLKW